MFREAARFRNNMIARGFTDNAGAIWSAERILDILAIALKYPGLSHRNEYRRYSSAEFSEAAHVAFQRGERVFIEHVAPMREFTRAAIAKIETATDADFEAWVKEHFRLVLLTMEEAQRLNRINRSKMTPDRLASAGIELRKMEAKNES